MKVAEVYLQGWSSGIACHISGSSREKREGAEYVEIMLNFVENEWIFGYCVPSF